MGWYMGLRKGKPARLLPGLGAGTHSPASGLGEAPLSLCQATGLSSPVKVTSCSWWASDVLFLALKVLLGAHSLLDNCDIW